MYDILIIGRGPAGLSASLYAARANLSVAVVAKDAGALERVSEIDNYFGFSGSGKDLLAVGTEQAKKLGAEFIHGEVVDLSWNGSYEAELANGGKLQAKAVILAVGSSRAKPSFEGISEYEGRGVSYCAVCDAFFFKGKDVAVLGSSKYAVSELEHLLPVAGSVTLLTDGREPDVEVPAKVEVITKPIKELILREVLRGVRFTDGSEHICSGLFVALGSAGGRELARKLGAPCTDRGVTVNKGMDSVVPGLFAAGDCVGNIMQVSTAVGDGAKAALSAIEFVRKQPK